MKDQSNRVVLITGGSSGIGQEMARQMTAQQSTVIICGRSKEKLASACKEVPQVVAIQCDITKEADRKRLFDEISAKFSSLNMLINNAGIVKRYLLEKTRDLEEKVIEEWQTNFLAPVLLAREFLPMLSKNKGTVVNVTSGLAYVPLSIQPNYCATKAALHSMTQSKRIQFAKLGVKVVEILYPAVDTPFQGGHAPTNAIKPQEAAAVALKGLNDGKEEIHVKMAGILFHLSRLMPKRALKILNNSIPVNSDELLADT